MRSGDISFQRPLSSTSSCRATHLLKLVHHGDEKGHPLRILLRPRRGDALLRGVVQAPVAHDWVGGRELAMMPNKGCQSFETWWWCWGGKRGEQRRGHLGAVLRGQEERKESDGHAGGLRWRTTLRLSVRSATPSSQRDSIDRATTQQHLASPESKHHPSMLAQGARREPISDFPDQKRGRPSPSQPDATNARPYRSSGTFQTQDEASA